MSTSDQPVIEVSHLPSASSFYLDIVQSLGISYLSASAGRINFGWVSQATDGNVSSPQAHVVFSLQQSTSVPAPRSSITLLANSAGAVDTFYRKALLANDRQTDHALDHARDESRARVWDLDGNMLEAVYAARAPGALPRRRTIDIDTASTPKEAQRVLKWQHDVAKSVASSRDESPQPTRVEPAAGGDIVTVREREGGRPPVQYRRADSYPAVSQFSDERAPPRLVRRETVQAERYRRPSEDNGGGLTGMKLVGTLLGATAGAAIAYAMVRSDSPPRYVEEPRRASYGDHPVPGRSQAYYEPRDVPQPAPRSAERPTERPAARSYISMDPREPQYVAEYTIAGPPPSRVHELSRFDERSHASHRSARSEQKQVRERSGSDDSGSHHERPLTILPRSNSPPATSQVSRRSHKSHRETTSAYHAKLESDRDSYVSARSQRTQKGEVRYDSGNSGTSTTTIRVVPKEERRSVVSARLVPLPESVVPKEERRSVVSARLVPLPESVAPARYAESVAPSDSVSSVGGKRERERLRDRMRERW